MDLSVVVVSHGHEAMLHDCLASLTRGFDGLDAEVILVDNLRNPRFSDALGPYDYPVQILTSEAPRGLAANANAAARVARGRYLLLLNPDTVFMTGRIADALHFMEDEPRVGVIGSKLLNRDGSVQASFRRFPTLPVLVARGLSADRWRYRPRFYRYRIMESEYLDTAAPVDWVIGAFMLTRSQQWADVGGMDEGFYLYYEDVDLCYRLRERGLRTYYFPKVEILHYYGRTSASRPLSALWRHHVQSAGRYFAKHRYLFRPPVERVAS